MSILNAKKVHFVGIGGIGVSGLAKILASRGIVVTGSDAEKSPITDELEADAFAVKLFIGHDASHVGADVEAVVYSGAVPEENPERVAAGDRGIPTFSYSQALGELTKEYQTIAVSGTHGKSTTTAMLGSVLIAAGMDPLVLVGTRVPIFEHGNVHLGKGSIFVVEACEHEAQMMNLSPERIVITNLESDHLDYYGTFEKLCATFKNYVGKIEGDHCVVNGDDSDVMKLFADAATGPKTFGFKSGDVRCIARKNEDGVQTATIEETVDGVAHELRLRIPGAFNVMNALAAFTMAREVGVEADVALKALIEYPGSWRRFERVGTTASGAPVISDYAHHPTAIRETLTAAHEFFPNKRVLLVYQPHQHHRTKALHTEFVHALSDSDALILNEVYHVRGREKAEDAAATSEQLMQDISAERGSDKPQWYASTLPEVTELIREHALPDDVVLVMGAGDIYKVAHEVCSK
ncbi:MAG: UDP-N-acetylmuramate--L-alanine ligase [Candidatus Magasanikbacteria bacterium]|nr:UDP-N-acetylmuramate--L-alanine ligase [Candidatus Magasanikbacteria bacterium]